MLRDLNNFELFVSQLSLLASTAYKKLNTTMNLFTCQYLTILEIFMETFFCSFFSSKIFSHKIFQQF